MDKTKLRIRIIDEPKPIELDAQITYINFKMVTNLLYKLKNIKPNQIEYIRYLTNENSFALLSLTTPDINISTKKNFELLVSLIKKEKPNETILSMIKRAKSLCSSLDKEILELKKPKLLNNSSLNLLSLNSSKFKSSNLNLLGNLYIEKFLLSIYDKKIDIIVLTANPLYLYPSNDHPKELRTLNDFNSITDSIYQAVSKCSLPVVSQFLTLTKDTLKYAISKKPRILHLICKSTYERNEDNVQKLYFPVLLFENERCETEEIDKDTLIKIFEENTDNIKDISLFLSTPLCEDAFNMINSIEAIKFRNLLVQHTTLADISFLTEFNQELYIKILDKQPLKQAFYSAKTEKVKGNQFCCCYHSHKDECILRKNLSNELFRYDERPLLSANNQGNNNHIKINNNEITKDLPHLYHLRYKCECETLKGGKNDFCYHQIQSCQNKENIFPRKKSNSICCCCTKTKIPGRHTLDDIFKKYFNEEDKDIFDDYEKGENQKSIIIDNDKLPKYGKMKYIIGLNKVFYNVFELATSKHEKIFNFYGNQYNALEMDNIISSIIEFIKERYHYFLIDNQRKIEGDLDDEDEEYDNSENNNSTNKIGIQLSQKKINNKLQLSKNNSINSSLSPKKLKSDKNIRDKDICEDPLPSFTKLNQDNIYSEIAKNKFKKNIIYVINAFKYPDILKDLKKIKDESEAFFIIFSQEEIKENNKNEKNNIRNICFNNLDFIDRLIINQDKKIENDKENFAKLLIEKKIHITEEEFIETQKLIEDESEKDEMYYLILYLFHCVNSGLILFEFNRLFPDDEELKKAENIMDFFVEKKIIKKEIKKDKDASGKEYTKYIKNEEALNPMINSLKIPEHIKCNILQRLFFYHAKKFRYLLKLLKDLRTDFKYPKGYEPDNTLFSFSAIQTLGIWLPLNNIDKFIVNENDSIYTIEGYFGRLNRNFKDIFIKDNIELCIKNKDIWDNVKESLEDICITLLTLYKIYNNNEIEASISSFKNFYRKFDFSKEAKLRFELFDTMQRDYDKKNKEKIMKDLELIEKGFSEIYNKEGQLETIYARIMIDDKDNIFINLTKVYEDKIVKILEEMKKDETNTKFVDLFDSKIKYKLMECKINKKQNELPDYYNKIIEIFDKNGFKFYVINTFLLINYFYIDKIKNKVNVDEYKIEQVLYFNCAYMYAIYPKNNKLIDYIVSKKHSLIKCLKLEKDDKKYKDFNNKIIKIYQKCNLNTTELVKEKDNPPDFFYHEELL